MVCADPPSLDEQHQQTSGPLHSWQLTSRSASVDPKNELTPCRTWQTEEPCLMRLRPISRSKLEG